MLEESTEHSAEMIVHSRTAEIEVEDGEFSTKVCGLLDTGSSLTIINPEVLPSVKRLNAFATPLTGVEGTPINVLGGCHSYLRFLQGISRYN